MAFTNAGKKKFLYSEHTGEYIDIQGIKVHFYAQGEGEALLLVHAPGQSAYAWRHNIEKLAERYFVIALDMIGYGYSDRPEITYSIEENSEFLLAFLNAMRIKSTHIAAMGAGAIYALDFMVHYPDRVDKAVCIAPGGVTPKFPLAIRMLKTGGMSRLGAMALGQRAVESMLHECVFDQTCLTEQDVENYFEPLDSRQAREVVKRSVANFNLDEVVSRLRLMPHNVLFVWGSEDRWRPLELSEVYKAAVENSQMLLIRNCGHLCNEEKPEKFNEAVLEFLKGAQEDTEQ